MERTSTPTPLALRERPTSRPRTTPAAGPPAAPVISLTSLLRDAWQAPGSRGRVLAAVAAGALLAVLFRANLAHFVVTWAGDENYSHGFLVPLIALYFANEASRRGPVPLRGGRRRGAALLAACVAARLLTIVVPIGILGDLALLAGIAGALAILAGGPALRRYGFALFFLVFMVPLPIALYARIAGPLQLMVSQVAARALNAVGVPVLCQGNMMTLPGGLRMFVAEACSGMRQLTGFLALTTAVAFLTPRPAWVRLLLVGASIPVAMFSNIVRVAATGLIMYHVDARYASGPFHMVEGLLMMALGLSLLGGLCSVVNWAWPNASPSEPAASEPPSLAPVDSRCYRSGLVLSVLVGAVVAQQAVEWATETPRPPLARPLATIPLRLGTWAGRDIPIDDDVRERSQTDDYLSRVYEDQDHPGRALTLWINYSRTGLNLRHSPEVCLPAGGWEKQEGQTHVLRVPRGGSDGVPMTRLAYRQGELVQVVGFWYYIFGEGRLERAVRQLPVTSRSSHGRTTRGSGLTVEVFCPGWQDPGGEGLRDFAASLLSELEPILPAERANYFRP